MLAASMMGHDYDRRRASKTMSPLIEQFLDKVAQVHKHDVEARAGAFGKDAEDEVQGLLRKHRTASDDEIAKLALPYLHIRWDDLIEKEKARFHKWVDRVVQQTAGHDVGLEDEHYTRFDADEDTIHIRCIAWGARYERDEDDPYNRVEVPATHDLHQTKLHNAFQNLGADAHVTFEWREDPGFGGADVCTFPMDLKWHYDGKKMAQKAGATAFEHAVKTKLPEWRKEVEEELAEEAARPPPAVAPPKPRGRRR